MNTYCDVMANCNAKNCQTTTNKDYNSCKKFQQFYRHSGTNSVSCYTENTNFCHFINY